jgi:hypothetical protein
MVKVLDPETGEMVSIADPSFEETGTQRFERASGDNVLVVEVKHWIKPSKRMYHNKEWLEEEYTVKGRTMADIAEQFGITPMSIHQWLGKHDIATRGRGRRK